MQNDDFTDSSLVGQQIQGNANVRSKKNSFANIPEIQNDRVRIHHGVGNADVAETVLPIIGQMHGAEVISCEITETKMYIAGATPDPRVKKAASDKIIVSGWLDDIRDAYAQSRVFIAPMRIGTGLQNKLLEAMSMRLPAITSPLANASLGAKPDEEILIGSNGEEMANNIITLLTNTQKSEQIAQAGFDFTNRVYDWGKATEILENAMSQAL